LFPLTTPIDRALPVIALLIVAIAVLCGRRASVILFGLPLLVACGICFPEEHMRLLGYGIVLAAVFCGAYWAIEEWTFARCAGLTIAGIALLRWIARERVEVWREIVIVAGALLIVAVMKKSPLAVAVALTTAFLTPGIPTRTLVIPFVVAAIVAICAPLVPKLVTLPAFVTAVMLIFFAWSGVAARGITYFFRATPAQRLAPLNFALRPGESVDVEVPGDAKSIAISAANGFRLSRYTVAGTLNGHPLTMRDLADWGYMRRPQWWRSRNRLPRVPAGIIRGYGYDAWVDGAGRIALPPHATRIRIAADPHLPAAVRLQVEAFER
jgi:hypothetical protein